MNPQAERTASVTSSRPRPIPHFGGTQMEILFAVRDIENGQRVLIDGNERAEALHYAVVECNRARRTSPRRDR